MRERGGMFDYELSFCETFLSLSVALTHADTLSVVYAVIARGPTVLCDRATKLGNVTSITERILEKVQSAFFLSL